MHTHSKQATKVIEYYLFAATREEETTATPLFKVASDEIDSTYIYQGNRRNGKEK
jgi:hypothetical protein